MNKTIATIKENLRSGKPLVILGPYGCGKFECLTQAIESAGLKRYAWFMYDGLYSTIGLRKWAKHIPGNGVLAIDDIDSVTPDHINFILEQARHPDRIMVLVGRTLPVELSYQKFNIIRFAGSFPYQVEK